MPVIMVVDDSDVDRLLVGGILQSGISDSRIAYAADGSQAIQQIAKSEPDLVVTDLQMPNQDGLQLVSAIRIQHPQVPVILMTGHGSEDLAVEALERGASSYVPKMQLQDRLIETVQDVLSLAKADRSYARLMDCLQQTRFQFSLENDPELIDPLIDLIQQIVFGMQLCDPTGRFRIGIALKEAVLNAILHGNLELKSEDLDDRARRAEIIAARRQDPQYTARHIDIKVAVDAKAASFIVKDEGNGFDSSAWLKADDNTPLDSPRGRGLVLMKSFCDVISFNETGNEVTLTKNRE